MQIMSITWGRLLSKRVEERTLGVLDVVGEDNECFDYKCCTRTV